MIISFHLPKHACGTIPAPADLSFGEALYRLFLASLVDRILAQIHDAVAGQKGDHHQSHSELDHRPGRHNMDAGSFER